MDRIYLDQGATTFPKPEEVYHGVEEGMKLSFNPNRGGYIQGEETERKIERGRRSILKFFQGRRDHKVIYSYSGTDGINMLVYGLVKKGQRIIIGPFEHNAVLRPLKELEKSGIKLIIAKYDSQGGIDLEDLDKKCREGIDYGIFSYTSNILGTTLPMGEISEIIHRNGGQIIVDGAQGAGHQKISLEEEWIDYFAASGHKGLLGPMGTGIVILPEDSEISPFRRGGTGIHSELEEMPMEYPQRLEAGTLNVPGIFGLLQGIEWLKSRSLDEIYKKEVDHVNTCIHELKAINRIHIYSIPEKSQIFLFNIEGLDSQTAARVLDQAYGISLRGGLHCAPLAHKSLGTFPQGAVRGSFSVFTKEEEIRKFIRAVRSLAAES